MRFQLFALSSLACLASSNPISAPLKYGQLDPTSREYLSSAAVRAGALKKIQNLDVCYNLTNIEMNYGSLPPPAQGLKLYHIAIGRGTQNYTCEKATSPTDAPTPMGAVAELYNATCTTGYLGSETTNRLTNDISQQPRRSNIGQNLLLSGNHYFADSSTATFNLHTEAVNYGISFSRKTDSIPAPANALSTEKGKSPAVPWLKLKVDLPPRAPMQLNEEDSASKVTEIYRLNTAGGAQATCEGYMGKTFTRDYAAEYWFWHNPN